MAISEKELSNIIRLTFPNAQIKIIDLAGDQDHYSLEIADHAFNGLTLLKQHMLVKNALVSVLGKKLHAITIKTIVP